MNYTLHKLKEGFILTSDEITREEANLMPHYQTLDSEFYKLIAQQDQIDFSKDIPQEKLKEIGWVDVEKLNENANGYAVYGKPLGEKYLAFKEGYSEGFQKAQELLSDRMFTLEYIRKAISIGLSVGYSPAYQIEDSEKTIDKIIKSLSQKSWPVELEMESKCKPTCLRMSLNGEDSTCCGDVIWQPKLTNGKIKITKIL